MKNKLRQQLLALICTGLVASSGSTNPTNPDVVAGNALFDQNGSVLSITSADGTIINWQDFSIAEGELTQFLQSGAGAAVLNRVLGTNVSEILGQLQSNGRVFLINQNGIVFGESAVIDTNGFVASTLDISNNDFLNNVLHFQGNGGRIENRGLIRVNGNGDIALLAPDIQNSGLIQTENGQILLAAGRDIEISSTDFSHITFRVQAPGDQVVNLGQIIADQGAISLLAGRLDQQGELTVRQQGDGRIFLEADDVNVGGSVTVAGGGIDVLGDNVVIENARLSTASDSGGGTIRIGGDYQGGNGIRTAATTTIGANSVIDASGVGNADGGRVIVWSDNATQVDGQILARGGANGGDGGFVETSSKGVLDFSVPVDASAPQGNPGEWLLDPEDITIDGGRAGSIETALNQGTSVTIQTSEGGNGEGNINVNAPITKTEGGDAGLSLIAHHTINVNQPITSTSNKLHVNLRAGAKVNINSGIQSNGGNVSTVITGIAQQVDSGDQGSSDEATLVDQTSVEPQATAPTEINESTANTSNTDSTAPTVATHSADSVNTEATSDTPLVVDVPVTDTLEITTEVTVDQIANIPVTEDVAESALPDLESIETSTGESSGLDAGLVSLHAENVNNRIVQVSEFDTGISIEGEIITQGGDISIDGSAQGVTVIAGLVDSSNLAEGQLGGDIEILADSILLTSQARIDASGDAGGGQVLVGGDYQGANPEVRNANFVEVHAGAEIIADAKNKGDGGQVVVWADDSTAFAGQISAKGGVLSGDAGDAEVSGKRHLAYSGSADLTALNGAVGTLLLDPGTVTISSAPNSGFDVFNAFDLGVQLDSANVSILTNNASAGPVDINVEDFVFWNSANTLTLTAGNDINFNGGGLSGGSGTVTLNAGNDINVGTDISAATVNANVDADDDNMGQLLVSTFLRNQDTSINATSAINVTGHDVDIRSGQQFDDFAGLNSDGTLNINVDGKVTIADVCNLGNSCASSARIGLDSGTITANTVSISTMDGTASIDAAGAGGLTINTSSSDVNGYGLLVEASTDNSANFSGAFINGPGGAVNGVTGALELNIVNGAIGVKDSSTVSEGFAAINFGVQDIEANYIELIATGAGNVDIQSVGQNQTIVTSGTNANGEGILIDNSGTGSAFLQTFDSPTQSFGVQTITNNGGGSLTVKTSSSGNAGIFGGGMSIQTDHLEAISTGSGNIDIDNANGSPQSIITTGSDANGRGISLVASGSGRVEIDSRLRTAGGGTTNAAQQTIEVQNAHDIFVQSQGAGTSGIFGGLQQITGGDLTIDSNVANAFVQSREGNQDIIVNSITLNAVNAESSLVSSQDSQSLLVSGANAQGHAISATVTGTGSNFISSDFNNGMNFVGLNQVISAPNGGIHLESTAASVGGTSEIFGGSQTINTQYIEIVAIGSNRSRITATGPTQSITTTGTNISGNGIQLSSGNNGEVQLSSFTVGVDQTSGDMDNGETQIINTNGQRIRIESTGSSSTGFNGIFAGDQTINAGGIELNADGVETFIQSEVGTQQINAEYIELIGRSGEASIVNQFGGAQTITTTGQKNGSGLLVQSLGNDHARIGSSTGPDGSIYTSPGLNQNINIQGGHDLTIQATSGGNAEIYGGEQQFNVSGDLNINSTASTGVSAVTSTNNFTGVVGGDLLVQAGPGPTASASIGPRFVNSASPDGLINLNLTVGGNATLNGGGDETAFAVLHATGTATVNVTGDLTLNGGAGLDADAIIRGDATNTVNISANNVTLNAGTGSDADALFLSQGGAGVVNITTNTCTNCDLVTPSNVTLDFGVAGSVINLTAPAGPVEMGPVAAAGALPMLVETAVPDAIVTLSEPIAMPLIMPGSEVDDIINSVVSLIAVNSDTDLSNSGDSGGGDDDSGDDDEGSEQGGQSGYNKQQETNGNAASTQCS